MTELVEIGSLMAHGPSVPARRLHNIKTAQALGLTIPPSLLLRADQVIE